MAKVREIDYETSPREVGTVFVAAYC